MQYFESLGVRPILHSFNLLRIHPDTFLANNMTQVLDFEAPKAHLDCLRKSWC
jgi:hypothetical protein